MPSIMLLPIPFIEDVVGTAAEYMMASVCSLRMAKVVAPREAVRKSARGRMVVEWRRR